MTSVRNIDSAKKQFNFIKEEIRKLVEKDQIEEMKIKKNLDLENSLASMNVIGEPLK